jgi:hypothetical protein
MAIAPNTIPQANCIIFQTPHDTYIANHTAPQGGTRAPPYPREPGFWKTPAGNSPPNPQLPILTEIDTKNFGHFLMA